MPGQSRRRILTANGIGENIGTLLGRHIVGRYGFSYDPNSSPGTAVAGGAPAQPTSATQQAAPATQAPPVAAVVQGFTAEQVAALQQSVTQTVTATVQAAVAPIAQQTAQLAARVEGLAQPVGRVNQLTAGAPAIRTGENILASRGFQYQRIGGHMLNYQQFDASNCKLEIEFCNDLQAWYQQAGMSHLMDNQRRSILVPLSASMIPDECRQHLATKWGDIGGLIQQGVTGADPGRLNHIARQSGMSNHVKQTLSMLDDSAMGVFTEAGPHGDFIVLIRNREALSRVGATNVTLPPNGYLPFGAQTGAGTAYWVGERAAITASEQTTGRKQLQAKKLACLTTLPNELLRFASVDTEAFIRADMARVMALKADLAGLEGTGTSVQPKGILNYSGIVTHTSSMSLGTDGNQFEPKTATQMQTELEERNYDLEEDGGAYLMRSKMWGNIVERRASPHQAGVYDGNFIFATNRDDVAKGASPVLRGFPVVKSSQVSNTRSKGASSSLTYVLFAAWKHLMIGRIGVMEFAMSNMGDTNFVNDQTSLRCIQFIDYALRYENAFVLCDQISMDLPA